MEGALYTASVELAFLLRDARIDLASGQDTLMLRRPGIFQNLGKELKRVLVQNSIYACIIDE